MSVSLRNHPNYNTTVESWISSTEANGTMNQINVPFYLGKEGYLHEIQYFKMVKGAFKSVKHCCLNICVKFPILAGKTVAREFTSMSGLFQISFTL